MIGLNTPVYTDKRWKLAKDIKQGDLITNSYGKLVPVKDVEIVSEIALSLFLSYLPFPLTMGFCTPIVAPFVRYDYTPKNNYQTVFACDLPKTLDVSAKFYTSLGSVELGSNAYSIGYIAGCNHFRGTISDKLFSRVAFHLNNIDDDLVEKLEDKSYAWNISTYSFHKGYADSLKDRFTNLSRTKSNILIAMDIAQRYSLADKNIRWHQSITSPGYITKSSSVIDISSNKLPKKQTLVNIATDGGLIAAGLRLRNENE